MDTLTFYKCLADETRLLCLLLIQSEGELCVCELTHALELSQPKISRHLARLRRCGLLADHKERQWVFYSIHSKLPRWASTVLEVTATAPNKALETCKKRLAAQGDRPQRQNDCC